ncbi:MAG: hypothetical protein ACC628_12045 [Pirellulaceae bacterium]
MTHKSAVSCRSVLLVILACASTGCAGVSQGPTLGVFGIPVPVSPYFQDKAEDRAWIAERYETVPILGPMTASGPAVALDPPSDDEVMRALEKADPIQGGVPFLFERQRSDVRVVKEKIADYVDPPRFIPTIGPAQLHHAHYKCTIYYSETTHVGYPIPHTLKDEDSQEVIYIDHNHFHMVGNIDTGVNTGY